MPKIDHPNFGDIQKHVYIQGTVLEVYRELPEDHPNYCEPEYWDTADIHLDTYDETYDKYTRKVPIFYHCSSETKLRENGALKGASAGFIPEDRIIILARLEDDEDSQYFLYDQFTIIGHVEGIYNCSPNLLYITVGKASPDSEQKDKGIYCTVWDFASQRVADNIERPDYAAHCSGAEGESEGECLTNGGTWYPDGAVQFFEFPMIASSVTEDGVEIEDEPTKWAASQGLTGEELFVQDLQGTTEIEPASCWVDWQGETTCEDARNYDCLGGKADDQKWDPDSKSWIDDEWELAFDVTGLSCGRNYSSMNWTDYREDEVWACNVGCSSSSMYISLGYLSTSFENWCALKKSNESKYEVQAVYAHKTKGIGSYRLTQTPIPLNHPVELSPQEKENPTRDSMHSGEPVAVTALNTIYVFSKQWSREDNWAFTMDQQSCQGQCNLVWFYRTEGLETDIEGCSVKTPIGTIPYWQFDHGATWYMYRDQMSSIMGMGRKDQAIKNTWDMQTRHYAGAIFQIYVIQREILSLYSEENAFVIQQHMVSPLDCCEEPTYARLSGGTFEVYADVEEEDKYKYHTKGLSILAAAGFYSEIDGKHPNNQPRDEDLEDAIFNLIRHYYISEELVDEDYVPPDPLDPATDTIMEHLTCSIRDLNLQAHFVGG